MPRTYPSEFPEHIFSENTYNIDPFITSICSAFAGGQSGSQLLISLKCNGSVVDIILEKVCRSLEYPQQRRRRMHPGENGGRNKP